MTKYLIKRILFSLFSIIVVVGTVMLLCYSLIDKYNIFISDPSYTRYNNNEKTMYEYSQFSKLGYMTMETFPNYLKNKYSEQYGTDYVNSEEYKNGIAAYKDENLYLFNDDVLEFYDIYAKKGYTLEYLPKIMAGKKTVSSAYLIARKDISVFERLWKYFTNLITFETIWDVTDENLTDRGIRIEWDGYSHMPAIIGNGTTHKYLLYFDDQFPFIHQNFFHINLGVSLSLYQNTEMTEILSTRTGYPVERELEPPSKIGTGETVLTRYDFHTVTYNYSELSALEEEWFNDKYTIARQRVDGLTRLGNSFVMGIIATIIAYMLGLPIGVWMSRRKDKLVDKVGNIYIIFIMAVPSLAYIFMFASLGMALFKLPYKFATADPIILGYILPIISLSLPSIGSLMKWMRRYMIDQQNSDYVKFARAEGLSESEIFSKHISRNALIYLVHGIPGSILGSLTGAIITERVYSVPGIGGLLTKAITGYDNGIIVGCTLFYTSISILSLILGDLLLIKYDPRISLAQK